MSRLNSLEPSVAIERDHYKTLLRQWQYDLLTLQQTVLRAGTRMVVNIEGMDAAGKGGAIRRMVSRLDPRGYKVYRIGAPEPWEQDKHYLYRFWTRIPAPGELVIFDRSWYGRVLVERVEGLASKAQWQRAYREINDFERMLVDDGVVVRSLWFQIGPDEQLERFERRLADPFKAWKMSDEDWRNRARWDDYIEAAEEMLEKTDTPGSPWTVIAANEKRHARLTALRAVATALAESVEPERLPSRLHMPAF
ncbi:MAG: polyphosphate kinase 2 [Xanthomonadales bacterium]|nr:polyphosphate kinase 2 [Xanthomonadales bacterium]